MGQHHAGLVCLWAESPSGSHIGFVLHIFLASAMPHLEILAGLGVRKEGMKTNCKHPEAKLQVQHFA